MKKNWLVGCDPECFILNAKGEPVSAAGIVPGSKQEPFKVPGGSVHPDGMAAEFGINPAATASEFVTNINTVIGELKKLLPEGHTLSFTPYVRFSPDVFDTAPEDAKELGCIPDFDAWTGEMNPVPSLEDDPYLRTASGHVHIGFPDGPYDISDEDHIQVCRDFVKLLDWYLGAWSCKFDQDPVRRKLYGKAGAFRPKPYGVEYRVLSNFWLANENRMANVFHRVKSAIRAMKSSYLPELAGEGDNQMIREMINTATFDKAFAKSWYTPLMETTY